MLRKASLSLYFALIFCNAVQCFQLSMVATRAPLGNIGSSALKRNQGSAFGVQPSNGVTSGLISQLAVTALKLRLAGQTHVSCDVTANPSDIFLRGMVGPVTVKGRGWLSRLGLTCRAIEATVDTCELDVGRIIANQKLVLTTPAKGHSLVALNAVDFGNFITHPLMRPPGLPGAGVDAAEKLEFIKDDVSIDAPTGKISFFGTYMDAKWKFTLERGSSKDGKAVISATPPEVVNDGTIDYDKMAHKLAEVTSVFFNNMVFELDGTFLTFRDMMLTDKGGESSVMLSLGILVKKFPSAGLAF